MATRTIEPVGSRSATNRGARPLVASGIFSNTTPEQVAHGLGWFSIALGLGEILIPGTMSRVVGANGSHGALMRFLGIREIAAGALILSGARAAGCWSRVAGDLMDLALLGGDLGTRGTDKGRAAGSTAAVVGVTVLDALTAWELSQSHSGAYDVRLDRAITVNKSPEECYAFWRGFERLPEFMLHLHSVRPTGENRTHWIANGPGGARFEWDAETTADRPGECISWRTIEGSDVDHSGSVRFERAPGDRGTIVRVRMYYTPPAKGAGAAIAKLLGQDPEQEVAKDLRRFKQVMETGDVVSTEGQPAGRRSGATWLDAAARY
jgi:uncharacterized membrane protein